MNQTDVRNAINVAELEGVKKVRERYPDMKVSDFPNRDIVISNTELHATLQPLLNRPIYTGISGTHMIENKHFLRQTSNSDLQNITLAECQDLYGNVNPQKSLDIDPESGLAASLGIISFLLSISNPVAAAVAGIASVIVPILWPTAVQDPNVVWQSMMANAEALIDAKLDQVVKNTAIRKLDGLKDVMNEYYKAITRLQNDPTDPVEQMAVRSQYDTLDSLFRYSMPQFSVENYELQLLPVYTEAANLHLLLIRDAVNYGSQWGMTQAKLDEEYSDLKERTNVYTNYCVHWFNTGLQRLASTTSPSYKPANMWDCTKYPWVAYNQSDWSARNPSRNCNSTLLTSTCDEQTNKYHLAENSRGMGSYRDSKGEYQGLENWNLYNDFRRDMTIMVLDIISVWPTYDPKLYPMGIKSELTRTLYTPIRGTTYRSDGNQNTLSAIENRMIQQPGLFTWLDGLSFQQINIPGDWVWSAGDLLTGGSQYRNYTLGNSFENQFGKTGTLPIRTVDLPPNSPITKVITRQWFEPREIELYKGNTHTFTLGTITERYPFFTEGCSGYPKTCIYDPARRENQVPKAVDPYNPSAPMTQWKDSHLLSYFKYEPIRSDSPFGYPDEGQIGAVAFGWTHTGVDPNNLIDPGKITQIPAVKGYQLGGNAKVVPGPGSTGGDLVQLVPGGVMFIRVTGQVQKGYQLRIRYASTGTNRLFVDRYMDGSSEADYTVPVNLPPTYSGESLNFNSFGYATMEEPLPPLIDTSSATWKMEFSNFGNSPIIIDKIEFIPIEGSVEEFEADQGLEKARKAVNALYTSDAKNALKLNVTDYAVDQAANLVECISEDFHAQEKMILLDQIRVAKRLSQARNLLHHGDFESPDWSGENGWKTSHHVSVRADIPIFKGRYLHMSGATSTQFSSNTYPTYVYQKVDESKLKSYTRYLVRGFVGNSKDLELLVERYGKDVHVEMDVPSDITYSLPMNECGGFDRCKPASYPTRPPHTCTCKENAVAHTDCLCQDKGNRTSTNRDSNVPTDSAVYTNEFHAHQSCGCRNKNSDMYQSGTHPQKSCGCKDPHVFTYHIDTGCVDMEENLGLFFALKIASESGVANIDNLEIIEVQPLTGEALARVKKREQKWKQEMAQKRL
ncbi:insecticidal delta-endotoxin Cry8Ea1 family protein [Bacillus toyonensis]|uniref:insecticidal delta-endotoxin Cry8Ea1 family protein n=1 Tax=Bacillus toyonensis TaxID=155322 RepID=UPI0009AB1D9C|nr:insecticidal delta-endotoxin Cry8Ea1 family protein [Bacillus toyonensis]